MTITQERPVDVINDSPDGAVADVTAEVGEETTDHRTGAEQPTSEVAEAANAIDAGGSPGDADPAEPAAADDQKSATSDAPAAAAAAADTDDRPGDFAWADARDLVLAKNVRQEEVELDPGFLADILARGVQEPITVRRDDDGRLVVRKGRGRTRGALIAGEKKEERYRVPVFIQTGALGMGDDEDKAAQVERIVDQWGENKWRHGMTEKDDQGVVQELLGLDLSAAAIGRALHLSRPELKTRVKVARSPRAAGALDKYDGVTLDQAAVLAEFDDDDETFKELTVIAVKQSWQFDRAVQQVRNRREDAMLIQARVAELEEAGDTRVVTDAAEVTLISHLRATPATPAGEALTEETHASCPGHALLVDVERPMLAKNGTVRTRPVCTDPAEHGHAALHDSSGKQVGKMTPEQKAECNRVIRNNKAWKAATTARLQWLREHIFARKTAPKDVQRYIAAILGSGSSSVTRAMEGGNKVACSLLGLAEPPSRWSSTPNPIVEAAKTASPARATMMTLAVLIGAAEEAMHTNTWRSPNESDKAYFKTLESYGYRPVVVEQLVNDPKADAEDTEATADDGALTGEQDENDDDADPADTSDADEASGPGNAGGDGAPVDEPDDEPDDKPDVERDDETDEVAPDEGLSSP